MSTQATERRVQPEKAFERYILSNPEVCDSCFSRVRTEARHSVLTLGGEKTRPVRHYRTEHATFGVEKKHLDEYNIIESWWNRTTCAECGTVGCMGPGRTLSQREAVELVDELADRCREADIPVHVPLMKRVVGLAKSNPELRGRDMEIFAKAVEGAIRHSQ